jgi:hypothetical protein
MCIGPRSIGGDHDLEKMSGTPDLELDAATFTTPDGETPEQCPLMIDNTTFSSASCRQREAIPVGEWQVSPKWIAEP